MVNMDFLTACRFKTVNERTLRRLRPGEAHCPKPVEKVRLRPSVVLNVSCNVHATVQDVHTVTKHMNNCLLLGEMPVAHERQDDSERV